jgi:transposase InsO family protein
MDFQGQGLALTGETEALAVMDSFTKTVFVLPLPDRTAPTFIPPLLNAIWFTRGSPDLIHSDAAPELLSALLAAVLDATGTQHTTTCGHNAQSNGEIESWWRFWNRCMKLLSPAEYLNWPLFSQRICFAYNSAPHESLGGLCPFELDFGSPPVSPFFPAITALPHPDDDAPRDDPPSPVSPAAYADALRTSTAAFHRFAA